MTQIHNLEFTERMAGLFLNHEGTLAPDQRFSRDQFLAIENSPQKRPYEFTLTIQVNDVDRFIDDPQLEATAIGSISHPLEKREVKIESATFNLFTRPQASPDLNTAKEMHYTLYLSDALGGRWTFFGFKEILKEDGLDMWDQTTTLYCYAWKGHTPFGDDTPKQLVGTGVLRISAADFIKQLGTFKTNDDNILESQRTLGKFLDAFASNLWQAYAPFVFTTTSARWNEHLFPMHTTQGVVRGEKTLHPLDTADGLTISLQRFKTHNSKNVVLLLHGLTTSTDMFIMPEHQNLVNTLHSQGFTDVWSLDWRGSGRFTYNLGPHRYTIDDIAKYDIPKAVEYIRAQCGSDIKIHVICHCVGSLSFMASLAAGHVSGIQSVISNSVSLTPQVKWQGLLKLTFGPEVLEYIFRYAYVSPRMPYFPGFGFGKWMYWMERMMRRECTEPACHLVSFMWGWGFPAAYKHRNIHPTTHRRLVDLFGGTSFHYYRHIRKMLFAKASISYESKNRVNYLHELEKRSAPPMLFISGAENNIFPGSNKLTYETLKRGVHSSKVDYVEFENYGHQDVFMGQYCHTEVFPRLIQFLKEKSA
ncbi:alpha/beta hydrolase [Bdellovibrio sp. HCB2-146]|uniref:alpha/beta hydrolase n=1 Tax=Bdellovibrio sp. HCB2-146 TaxID=3394362 RepID=UPI0039BCB221